MITALALFVLALVNRRAIDRPALALAPLLAFTGILSQAAARGDAFHFPKYIYFVAPLLCLFVAGELVRLLAGDRDAAATSASVTRPAPVTLSPPHPVTLSPGHPVTRSPGHPVTLSPPHPVTLSPGHLVTLSPGHPVIWQRWAAAVVLLALLGLSAAQAWRSIQTPGGTLYDPGEVGLVEAAQAARAEAPADAILLARKDAAFLAQRDFIEWEGPLLTDPQALEQTIEQYGIRYLIAGPLLLGPEAQATWPYLSTAFEVVLDAGDYVLLRKY